MTFGKLGALGRGFGSLGSRRGGIIVPRMALSGNTLPESATIGTVVGTVSASGTSGTPVWSEVADPSGLFAINSSTGVITTTGFLDYETATSHSYTVGVSGVTPALSNTVFTIFVTNVVEDTTPDAFSFTDVTGATPSTLYTSDAVSPAGIDGPAAMTVTGGEYQKNGGAWSSVATTYSLGDSVKVQRLSSPSYSTAVGVTLTIGGVSDTFDITTMADPGVGVGSVPTYYILGF